MLAQKEEIITCPYCWESIEVLLDLTASQSYVEDCQVCCQPILFNLEISEQNYRLEVERENY